MPLSHKKYIMEGGERYAILLQEDGVPAFYPSLYITSQIRKGYKGVATQEQHLVAIKILLEFCDENKINIVERIRSKEFLALSEIEALHNECRKKRQRTTSRVVSLKRGHRARVPSVQAQTTYIYLTRIADYLEWLSKTLLSVRGFTRETAWQVERFVTEIRRGRPTVPNSGVDDEAPRGLSERQEIELFELMEPGHPENPFAPYVQFRNYLILKLLRLLGPRGGELFNIKIKDFNFSENTLSIVKRPNDPEDTRPDQALVKTRQRVIPVAPSTMIDVRRYIVEFRKRIPNAKKHSFLMVTHKSGPTQGQPLSLSSLQYIFDVIAESFPRLDITAHDLRHRWNVVYSEEMDKTDRSPEEIEQSRAYLEGWVTGSKQGLHYGARHVRKKAHEASLTVQENSEKRIRSLRDRNVTPEESS